MSQEVLVKTNEITEGILDYVKTAAEYADAPASRIANMAGLGSYYQQARDALGVAKRVSDKSYRIDKEGFLTGKSAKPIQFSALAGLGDEAIKRGAGTGLRLGAAGGSLLGAAIASGGIPRALSGAYGGFRAGKGGLPGKLGSAAFNLAKTLVGSGVRGGIGAGLGAVGGGAAGFRGGRETGAKIAGAAAGGTIPATLFGPFAGGAGGLIGAAGASDIASALTKAQKTLRTGGPDSVFFRS